MKRILKEDVVFRLRTERERFPIQEITNGFGVFPDREVNPDRDVAFFGNEVWLPSERVITFWVSSENLRLQRRDGFVEVVEARIPRGHPGMGCPGEIVVRGSQPRDCEDVRVLILCSSSSGSLNSMVASRWDRSISDGRSERMVNFAGSDPGWVKSIMTSALATARGRFLTKALQVS